MRFQNEYFFVLFLLTNILFHVLSSCGKESFFNLWEPTHRLLLLLSLLEKEMATQCSALAWKIPWTEKPGRLQSMGSQRVGHDWATSLSLFTFLSSLSLVQSFANPLTVAHEVLLFMGFPRQEYQDGLSFPSPEDLPYTGIEPTSPTSAGGFFNTKSPGKPTVYKLGTQ